MGPAFSHCSASSQHVPLLREVFPNLLQPLAAFKSYLFCTKGASLSSFSQALLFIPFVSTQLLKVSKMHSTFHVSNPYVTKLLFLIFSYLLHNSFLGGDHVIVRKCLKCSCPWEMTLSFRTFLAVQKQMMFK